MVGSRLSARRPLLAAVAAAALVSLATAAEALAETFVVESFDGTPIVTNFFPAEGLEPGERAPTVAIGPGWSGAGATDPGTPPIAPFAKAGYNVVTWDPRGFGGSGGEANIDSPELEARDVSAIIDAIATRPEVALDAPGDPRLGMAGGSYGGGIQLVTAATDPRVDAIAPEVAWHSLVSSLFKAADIKVGWGLVLCAAGIANGTVGGLASPAGPQTTSLHPTVQRACIEGMLGGRLRAEDVEWFRARGPAGLLGRITAPTLIVQGTVDTLFTLQEAVDNYAELERETDVPLKMIWFCGGHGVCNTGAEDDGHVQRRVLAWMDRWLKGDLAAAVGPRFEWQADDGAWRSAGHFPLARAGGLRGEGSGTLPLPGAAGSGALILATPGSGLDVPIEPASAEVDLIGAPTLRLIYTGHGAPAEEHVYAQIVDEQRGIVVGNQVTPIPVTLDGRRRSIDVDLEVIAARARPGDRYRLQLLAGSTLYHPVGALGTLTVHAAEVELPVVDPALRPQPDIRLTRRCRDGRLRMALAGRDVDLVRDVNFKLGKRLAARDTAAPFVKYAPRKRLRRTRARNVRAVVYLTDRPPAERLVLSRSLLRCGR